MRRLFATLLALGLLAGTAAAQDLSPGSRGRPLSRGRTAFVSGGGVIIHPAGVVYSLNGSVSGATGTGEQTPAGASYTLPVGGFDVIGRRVRATAAFKHAANGNNCTFKLYFGSEVISSGADGTTGDTDTAQVTAVKTGASTQEVVNSMTVGTTPILAVITAATETDSAPIVIKATVQGGSTGADCAVSDMFVEYLN